jgi:hypothetical protein
VIGSARIAYAEGHERGFMTAPAATRSRPDRTGAVRAPDTPPGQKGGAAAAPRATRGACAMTPNRGSATSTSTSRSCATPIAIPSKALGLQGIVDVPGRTRTCALPIMSALAIEGYGSEPGGASQTDSNPMISASVS